MRHTPKRRSSDKSITSRKTAITAEENLSSFSPASSHRFRKPPSILSKQEMYARWLKIVRRKVPSIDLTDILDETNPS